ncbi:unnamed protein product (macronuclear) [Paramecium tetraurelia]|uniref:Uncharacterized protein n=1 Tax=Paramecium tetraurelia TaxID=5888 RepID=A0D0R8_PARTE|nr:uncharacterized protein GSPATT00012187001 [Paramecium tetraurelia]CAK76635.1 unnamed protein product [Paramecium tetraurelia]
MGKKKSDFKGNKLQIIQIYHQDTQQEVKKSCGYSNKCMGVKELW